MTRDIYSGRFGMVALASLVCFASVSVAQQREKGESFKFSLRTGIEYTDNTESQPDALAEDNMSFLISPRIDAYINMDRTLTDIYYQPSIEYRTDPTDAQNDEDIYHILGIALDHKMSRATVIRLREEFIMNDNPEVAEAGSVVRNDQTHFVNRLSVGVKHELTRSSYADIRGRYNIKRFDDNAVADESDEDAMGGDITLFKKLGQKSGVNAYLAYETTDFESKTFGIKRGSDVITLAGGFQHALSEVIQVGGRAGVDMVDHEDSGLDSETEPYVSVNANVSPTTAVRMKGTVSHGVRDADVFPFSTQTYTEFRGTADIDTSEVVTIGGKVIYRNSEYDEDDAPDSAPATAFFGPTSGDETTLLLSAYAQYKMPSGSRIRVSHQFEDVDSDVEVTYSKNTSKAEFIVDF